MRDKGKCTGKIPTTGAIDGENYVKKQRGGKKKKYQNNPWPENVSG